MTETARATEVRQQITVAVPPERAFAFFTEHFDDWWPVGHHIGAAPEYRGLESGVGGRWYDRAPDGTETAWGHVLVWEPPGRLVLSWQIDGDFRLDPDPAHASEIEVRFAAEGAGTRVELVHRHLDRHGETWPALLNAVGERNGWSTILARYAGALVLAPVRASITVAAPPERAWQVYTEQYGSWYPKEHFIGSEPLWGHVLAWQPPSRLVLSWEVGGDWKHDPDRSHASEVEVLFSAVPAGTRVDLEHRDLGRHGDGAASIAAGVSDENYGHPFYLRRFAAAAEGSPPA
jgi:uncharacterized protein YndB with AHSA1/START domain